MEVQTPPSGDTELRYWETPEYRDKYSDDDRKDMADAGQAMPDGSYPIKDQEDLDNAIHAVGRGGADHDAIRKHIIARAHALGAEKSIPDNWNADGSLKQDNAQEAGEERGVEEGEPAQRGDRQKTRRGASERRKERHRAVPLGREVRFFNPEGLEVRELAAGTDGADVDQYLITGSPIMYGVPYTVVDFFGEFRETIHCGSVAPLLSTGVDTVFLLNHDGLPMARTSSGTMRMWDTSVSLNFEARLDARQQLSNDFAIAVSRQDICQMSIGMIVGNDDWGWDDADDMETRDIFGLHNLLDISGVTFGCSPTTHIEVAQRMALGMQIQSNARMRQMVVDLRAGKTLSANNQSSLVAALGHLLDLATAGGIDTASMLQPDGGEDTVTDGGEDMDHEQDGAVSGDEPNIESDAGISFPDGSGSREAEPESERRAMKASTLRLIVETGRHPTA